jgi:hypothetical protein
MQQVEESSATINKKLTLTWLPYVLFIASITATLIAIFAMSGWVEVSGIHHAIQHVVIFSSGLTAGGSLLGIHKTKKEK